MRYEELTESIKLDPVMFRTEDDLRKYSSFIKDELQDKDPSKIWATYSLNRDPGKFLVISIRPKDNVIQGWLVNSQAKLGWRFETLVSKNDIYSYLKYCGRGMTASHLQDIGARFL